VGAPPRLPYVVMLFAINVSWLVVPGLALISATVGLFVGYHLRVREWLRDKRLAVCEEFLAGQLRADRLRWELTQAESDWNEPRTGGGEGPSPDASATESPAEVSVVDVRDFTDLARWFEQAKLRTIKAELRVSELQLAEHQEKLEANQALLKADEERLRLRQEILPTFDDLFTLIARMELVGPPSVRNAAWELLKICMAAPDSNGASRSMEELELEYVRAAQKSLGKRKFWTGWWREK
jgi:hypothetical protein